MGLNTRQRWAIGTAVIAVGALVADQMSLLPGPSSASAAAAAVGGESPRIVSAGDLVALATKLQSVCEAAPAWGAASTSAGSSRDPFESPWKVLEEAVRAQAGGADEPPAPVVRALPELTAIVSTGGGGYAVLDGRPLAVGSSRDGYTLIDLSAETATVSVDGEVFRLALHDRNKSP